MPAVSVWRDAASPATKCTIATGGSGALAADFHRSVEREIFINDGEGVMSSRCFPDYPAQLIFSGSAGCILLLAAANCMIE